MDELSEITDVIVKSANGFLTKKGSEIWNLVKSRISERLGADNPLAETIHSLEKKPESRARQEAVAEEVAESNLSQLEELVQMLLQLRDEVIEESTSSNISQVANGSYIAQADRNSSASVKIR